MQQRAKAGVFFLPIWSEIADFPTGREKMAAVGVLGYSGTPEIEKRQADRQSAKIQGVLG